MLTPDSTVYETNLRPFAFELVTSGKVLHVFGADDADKAAWMEALRRNIRVAPTPAAMDPVQAAARKRARIDAPSASGGQAGDADTVASNRCVTSSLARAYDCV